MKNFQIYIFFFYKSGNFITLNIKVVSLGIRVIYVPNIALVKHCFSICKCADKCLRQLYYLTYLVKSYALPAVVRWLTLTNTHKRDLKFIFMPESANSIQ